MEENKPSSKYFDEINKAMLSNSEAYDKAILTLSSAGLGMSISFIRFVVDINNSEYTLILKAGWICFLIAIISTIASFRVSQMSLKRAAANENKLVNNDSSMVDGDNNLTGNFTELLNWASGGFFLIASVLIVVFVTLNI